MSDLLFLVSPKPTGALLFTTSIHETSTGNRILQEHSRNQGI